MLLRSKNTWLQESTDPDIINEAGKSGNSLTLWHRPVSDELKRAVADLPHELFPDARLTGSVADFTHMLRQIEHQTGAGAYRQQVALLNADMLNLAEWFDERWGATHYVFRLHPLTDTMCPRFHTDRGSMRLLTTYRGPGTEFVQEHGVNRRALQTIGTTNDEIVADTSAISFVPNYCAALLCGSDDKGRGGVVHRSPEIPEGTNRLTFCITLAD